MCFSRDQFLVFGLGVAATAALSYKFTKHLFGRQAHSNKQSRIAWRDSGCPPQDGGLVANGINKTTMTNFTGQTHQQWMSDDVMNNNHIPTTIYGVTTVGCQIGSTFNKLVDSYAQTDVIQNSTKSEENVVALNLKLNHTNVFMLKKHFDENLSKELIGDLNVAFFKSKQIGNYIIIEADNKIDLKVSTTFCGEKYQGEIVPKSMLPWRLFFETSPSLFKALGEKGRSQE